MAIAQLEHANFTVSDPKATAAMLQELFGWETRWEGSAMNGDGYTMHVGTSDRYLALYGPKATNLADGPSNYLLKGGLNHLGVVVEDLDAVEQAVKNMGLKTHSHADYEPGKRFYFHDKDGIEFEVVSYA